MNELGNAWVWNVSSPLGVAGVFFFGVYVLISLYHLRQTHFTGMRLLTEGLKFCGAVLLLLTLLQPEKHERSAKHEEARIAVVVDQTDSMDTGDIWQDGQAMTRRAWVQEFMQSEEWKALASSVQLEVLEMGHTDQAAFRETNLSAALGRAKGVDSLAAVVVLSDGGHNAAESPLPEMMQLSDLDIPAFAVEVGAEKRLPDLILERVDFPSYAIMNEAMVLPVRVRNTLPDDSPVRVVLRSEGQVLAEQEIRVPSGGSEDTSLRWTPRVEGSVNLKVQVDPHPLERFPDNNMQQAEVAIRRTTIRVLLIDSLPRWEFRYLRNALSRDPGVEVDSLLYHSGLDPQEGPGMLAAFPASRDSWSAYDVVFLGDVGLGQGELSESDIRNLDILVREQGSGLVFLPGARGGQLRLAGTPLERLNPVEYDPLLPTGRGSDQPMRMALTREGREHLLTQLHSSPARNAQIWSRLPGFHWYAGASRARIGSEVLATHTSRRNEHGRIPLLATRNAGTGHVLFLGTDGAWRWRRGVEDLYHYRFWGQVVRWMAHKRHMFDEEGARVFIQPERPQVGQPITLTLSLRGARALPEDIPFRLRIRTATGEVLSPEVTALEGGGTYQTQWVSDAPGEVVVSLLPLEGDTPWLQTPLEVEGKIAETRGDPLEPALLRELVQITGGESVGLGQARNLLVRLQALPQQQQVLTVTRLWQHPGWVMSVFGFFSLYWILRKRQGWV